MSRPVIEQLQRICSTCAKRWTRVRATRIRAPSSQISRVQQRTTRARTSAWRRTRMVSSSGPLLWPSLTSRSTVTAINAALCGLFLWQQPALTSILPRPPPPPTKHALKLLSRYHLNVVHAEVLRAHVADRVTTLSEAALSDAHNFVKLQAPQPQMYGRQVNSGRFCAAPPSCRAADA